MALQLAELPFPVRIRPNVPMTDDELLRFCAANDGLRIERNAKGELIVMTPAGSESSGRNMDISTDLNVWARGDGRGKAFDSSGGFTLPDGSMRSPDAAWIDYKRWNALTPVDRRRFAPICPDFIIELRSESDNVQELQAKMEQWIANGAQLAWLIDPIEQAVAIHRPGQPTELLAHPTSVQGDGPMAGFELVMERIWA